MKKARNSVYYKNSATCYLTFCFLGIGASIVGFFSTPHGFEKFYSGIFVAIVMAILAIVQANKIDSPDKEKIQKWGKIGLIISIVIAILFSLLIVYVARNIDVLVQIVN